LTTKTQATEKIRMLLPPKYIIKILNWWSNLKSARSRNGNFWAGVSTHKGIEVFFPW